MAQHDKQFEWGDVLTTKLKKRYNDKQPDPAYFICLGTPRRKNKISVIPVNQKTVQQVNPDNYTKIGSIKDLEVHWLDNRKEFTFQVDGG